MEWSFRLQIELVMLRKPQFNHTPKAQTSYCLDEEIFLPKEASWHHQSAEERWKDKPWPHWSPGKVMAYLFLRLSVFEHLMRVGLDSLPLHSTRKLIENRAASVSTIYARPRSPPAPEERERERRVGMTEGQSQSEPRPWFNRLWPSRHCYNPSAQGFRQGARGISFFLLSLVSESGGKGSPHVSWPRQRCWDESEKRDFETWPFSTGNKVLLLLLMPRPWWATSQSISQSISTPPWAAAPRQPHPDLYHQLFHCLQLSKTRRWCVATAVATATRRNWVLDSSPRLARPFWVARPPSPRSRPGLQLMISNRQGFTWCYTSKKSLFHALMSS